MTKDELEMNKIEYRVLTLKEISNIEGDIKGFDKHRALLHPNFYDLDFKYGLVRCVNNVPTEVVFIDGGEPEDQILSRDLAPLVNELDWLSKRIL